jgi:DNA-binding IclR family transcriptional regulator
MTGSDIASQGPRTSASSEVAERVLQVLLCFIGVESDLGVTDIARRVQIDKSRVHRYLVALKRKGFVVANPRTRRYSLGFRVVELARELQSQLNVERDALPSLRELRDATGESAALAMRVGGRRVYLTEVVSTSEIRQTFPIGQQAPLHVGATGRVLLAFLPEDERTLALADSMALGPPCSAAERARIPKTLERIQRQGYAVSHAERVAGSRSVAAPVWTWRGDLLAIVLAGPDQRLTEQLAYANVPVLRKIASQLTSQLGGTDYARAQPQADAAQVAPERPLTKAVRRERRPAAALGSR